jgi:hypothetical protein
MLSFVKKYRGDVYSQNGEDFLIQEVLRRIDDGSMHRCVEFGAADGCFCSNTANLIINKGWQGKMIEGEEMLFNELLNNQLLPDEVDCVNAFVTPANVNHLVPECDVLSIDVDGEDMLIWSAFTKKPAVVIIEINSSIHPVESHYSKDRGSSYITMVSLGLDKGYFLLCHTGNLIFVDQQYRKKFPDITGQPLSDWEKYFKTDWL